MLSYGNFLKNPYKYVILKLGRASFVCTKEQHHIHQEKKNFNKEKTKKRGKP